MQAYGEDYKVSKTIFINVFVITKSNVLFVLLCNYVTNGHACTFQVLLALYVSDK